MNRKEYEHKMQDSKSLSESMLSAINYITSLEQRIAESEQRVKELEGANSIILKKLNEVPSTCEGCKYYDENIFYRKGNDCRECSRYMTDYYEPKEQK